MPTGHGIHFLLVGAYHGVLPGANVNCERHGLACSVTEAQSHDEGRGGRCITGVHGRATGMCNKSATGGMEK